MTERHKAKPHRFDVTVTDPRRTGHKARARCGCGWSGEVLRPLADARRRVGRARTRDEAHMKWLVFVALLALITAVGPGAGWGLLVAAGFYTGCVGR